MFLVTGGLGDAAAFLLTGGLGAFDSGGGGTPDPGTGPLSFVVEVIAADGAFDHVTVVAADAGFDHLTVEEVL